METIVTLTLNQIEEIKKGNTTKEQALLMINEKLTSGAILSTTIEQDCAHHLITALNAPQKMVSSFDQRIPVRHIHHNEIPKVRQLPDNRNGLIHGGIVLGEQFDLVCRAFRWFRYEKIYFGKKSRGQWFALIEEVAGTCAIKDKAGNTIEKWSTGNCFKQVYNNIEAYLPEEICHTYKSFIVGNIQSRHYPYSTVKEGFYVSDRSSEKEKMKEYDAVLRSYDYAYSDTAIPNESFYANCRSKLYGGLKEEEQKAWMTDLKFNPDFSATPGFVINSPYIKVYAPENTNEALVILPAVYRKGSYIHSKRPVTEFKAEANWQSKIFTL